ncbi:YugN family protein [Sporosarcina trichiuri]|uniref:YugN family protein n=1 Tax=Sporosarcina trichiuri TaxID=3056445 RepID=UPI0025B5C34F|nr:YugN family protein [Sporosarcina sp. 0.2-SM1T-5]WJY27371.1 YugN family protein [Sporosarcina sp. 0.2-SM1T-5]
MIALKSKIEGTMSIFGDAQKLFNAEGMELGGGWEYDHGTFDTILYKRKEITIYLRVPFKVLQGELDSNNAVIQFGTPFLIKHVMNIGLDQEESATMTVSGLEQFQAPKDKDAPIDRKEEFATEAGKKLDRIVDDVTFATVG